ncbi:MAG: DUF4118 domain-containing protein [Lachnospiraceae bacterium]|nr:DUF4118 domain-containing protein [Lachnospiraceae bacterium]
MTAVILCSSFLISLLLQNVFQVHEHITTVFVFAVFLISLLTNSYIYGIAAAFISMLAVNYAFTFPFFTLDFMIPVNLISSVIMIIIAISTSTLTTKIKQHEAMKAEAEKEGMRANLMRAVSHDLRTPLTTIYGSASALLENRQRLNETQQDKILQGIQEDAEWLMRMVENLLSITRIDSGKVKIIKAPIVLEELIDAVLLKFKKRYPVQKILLELPDDMVVIPMDAILIEQVIINLLENAVQHAKGMTELSLRVFVRDCQAIFEIRDNGCGIPPEFLPHIFTGCSGKKENAADGQKRNAGIGLSVCATIVKAHGGKISAENASSGGSVFRFILNTEETEHEQQQI